MRVSVRSEHREQKLGDLIHQSLRSELGTTLGAFEAVLGIKVLSDHQRELLFTGGTENLLHPLYRRKLPVALRTLYHTMLFIIMLKVHVKTQLIMQPRKMTSTLSNATCVVNSSSHSEHSNRCFAS